MFFIRERAYRESRPAGSYVRLKNWPAEEAKEGVSTKEKIESPGSVICCIFDNEQVVGKRYSVKTAKSAAPVSVITSHTYLSIDPESNLQLSND